MKLWAVVTKRVYDEYDEDPVQVELFKTLEEASERSEQYLLEINEIVETELKGVGDE